MKILTINDTKQWLKTSQHPFAKFLFCRIKALLSFELPAPKLLLSALYSSYCLLRNLGATIMRIVVWTPLLKGRIQSVGRNLNLYGGLPFISGPLHIQLGNHCRLSGQTTFSGRTCAQHPPQLLVGDNVDIGWMTTIAVGQRIEIGDNVRIAGRALLAGYPGHPLNARARALGAPETDDQVGDIILEQDVWLATNVSVMAGVRIGRGAIIAAGSVVTKDIPPMVLAGGVPAQVLRSLNPAVNQVKEVTNGQ